MRRALLVLVLLAAALAIVVCRLQRGRTLLDDPQLIARAAASGGVPAALLSAIAWTETRNDTRSIGDGRRQWIRLDHWNRARDPRMLAGLAAADRARVDGDPALALWAAARLLRESARRAAVPSGAPAAAWRRALLDFSGLTDPVAAAFYADEVIAVAGQAGTPAHPLLPPGTPPSRPLFLEGSAAGRRCIDPQRRPTHIVIHTTENTFPRILQFLRAPTTHVGTHYLVRASDGLVVQMNDEHAVVFHDACFNESSIGIEHEGVVAVGERWYSDAMYRSSARLVRDIADRYGIPLDRQHILGHGETPDCSDHTDPGPSWDWDRYLDYVRGRP